MMKYPRFDMGTAEYLLNVLGEANGTDGMTALRQVQTGKKRIRLLKAKEWFFDGHGWRLPFGVDHSVQQMDLGDDERHPRYWQNMHGVMSGLRVSGEDNLYRDLGLPCHEKNPLPLKHDELRKLGSLICETIEGTESIKHVAHGVKGFFYVPPIGEEDYGELMDRYLGILKTLYLRGNCGRGLCEINTGSLAGKVKIAPGTRHDKLVETARSGLWQICVIFPEALAGYSILAQRQQLRELPEEFSLAGGLDGVMALAEFIGDLTNSSCYNAALSGVQTDDSGQTIWVLPNAEDSSGHRQLVFDCAGYPIGRKSHDLTGWLIYRHTIKV